jgi:GNAT superfamily N-acetyltransferase
MADVFAVPGWNKPREQYSRYLEQHEAGEILCLVARVGTKVAGYLKIVWVPGYEPLRKAGIPEIQDLNVLDEFRRQGVATRLLNRAEREVAKRSAVVGIGVGLHPGYNAAQRLYVLRGYVPDGLGVTYKDEYVTEGQTVTFDDDLVLHFTKNLEARGDQV